MLQTIYRSRPLPSIFQLVDEMLGPDVSTLKSSSMNVDLVENPQSFVLKADLPGVQKEDIQIDFKDGYLTISVESKESQESKEGETVLRLERKFSKKTRSFQFDDLINVENITASYENGVLTLELPKKEQQNSIVKIEIK